MEQLVFWLTRRKSIGSMFRPSLPLPFSSAPKWLARPGRRAGRWAASCSLTPRQPHHRGGVCTQRFRAPFLFHAHRNSSRDHSLKSLSAPSTALLQDVCAAFARLSATAGQKIRRISQMTNAFDRRSVLKAAAAFRLFGANAGTGLCRCECDETWSGGAIFLRWPQGHGATYGEASLMPVRRGLRPTSSPRSITKPGVKSNSTWTMPSSPMGQAGFR